MSLKNGRQNKHDHANHEMFKEIRNWKRRKRNLGAIVHQCSLLGNLDDDCGIAAADGSFKSLEMCRNCESAGSDECEQNFSR